jgi:fluoride exporter
MQIILSIACGGAIGAVSRYLVFQAIQNISTQAFPYGMLVCNILGSIVLGLLYDSLSKVSLFNENTKLFLQVGILGSFTTFSGFSLESFIMFEKGDYYGAIIFISVSVILSILGLISGVYFMRILF